MASKSLCREILISKTAAQNLGIDHVTVSYRFRSRLALSNPNQGLSGLSWVVVVREPKSSSRCGVSLIASPQGQRLPE